MLTYDEELEKLIEHCIKHMVNQIRDSIPESGRFDKVFITFITHYTKEHRGLLSVEPSSPDKQRNVIAGVIKEGTDKQYWHFMATGTNEELLRYFSDEGTKAELKDSYKELFASADED